MGQDIVLTTYLTGRVDPQRGYAWKPDYEATRTLRESVERSGQALVILNDCFDEPDTKYIKHIKVETAINPYFQRWLVCFQYLRDHPEIAQVFSVDSTDVEMLRNPFPELGGYVYVGDEPTILACPWMRQHSPSGFNQMFRDHGAKTLLNTGILGGSREIVMKFIHEVVRMCFDNFGRVGEMDMPVFNYVAYSEFADQLSHGRRVNTEFKKFDRANTTSWFRHK